MATTTRSLPASPLPASSPPHGLLPSSASVPMMLAPSAADPFQRQPHWGSDPFLVRPRRQHSGKLADPSLEPEPSLLACPPPEPASSRPRHGPCMVSAFFQPAVERGDDELPTYPLSPPPPPYGPQEGAPPHLVPAGWNPPPSYYYANSHDAHYSPEHCLQPVPAAPMFLQHQFLPPPPDERASPAARQRLLGLKNAASRVFHHDAAAAASAGGNLAAAVGGGASHSGLHAASHHPDFALPSHNAATVQQLPQQQRGSYYVPSPAPMPHAPPALAMRPSLSPA